LGGPAHFVGRLTEVAVSDEEDFPRHGGRM
jgi:hypothetical protein